MVLARRALAGFWCAAVLAACSGGSHPSSPASTGGGAPDDGGVTATGADGGAADGGTPDAGSPDAGAPDAGTDGGTALTPPFTKDGWTFYGTAQGLSRDVNDASADEGGNVYVAGGDALYAKRRGDAAFQRYDAAASGLTQNCYAGLPAESDPAFPAAINRVHPAPPGAPRLCPVVSVAGAAPGTAVVGLKGIGTDEDLDADWAQDSGGADLVQFDGAKLSRTRHLFLASPPQTVCVAPDASGRLVESRATSCPNPPDPFFWQVGRRKLRQVLRIAVNHQAGTPLYGDAFLGGTHASITAYLHDSAARGLRDRTAGQPAKWADAKDVWEHDHPAFWSNTRNAFLTGYTHAVAVDPRSGTPWCSNGFRTAWLRGYGADLHDDVWWLEPETAANPLWYDFWPDNAVPTESIDDNVESLAFCDDGTLWIGSSAHGLARRDPGGGVTYLSLPDPGTHGDSVYAVACDPSDQSVWIGLGWGGLLRWRDGQFTALDPAGLPDFARQPVRSIQIDRWSNPRIVYAAFMASADASGAISAGGGVAAYAGP
ncbi:hypothetical protein [Anaeromyxobacter diazotrophicus]|uniref:Uncharacterized protein n=1 Tax=Anaeromyxobacter diazotrophicus TaxID=2590199 RepID=A0A7I9VTD9_9BACT|nr:hypothetical protein [Anaeromyxobacter diazotrophicus]GEJ59400.1 hypothetical protein AMYX_41410 [Anaeromyxobacter diazotrophicus]